MRKFICSLLAALLIAAQLLAQNRTISGKVTDNNGNAISNASVVVKGSSVGTTTRADGTFSLSLPSNARAILISYIGMGEKEISLNSSNTYNTTLTSSSKNDLQEVVVVGYGTQRRSDVTSSISTVKAKDIENRPTTSVDQMLQGKVAGLQAPLSTGQPGAAQPIRIRGIGSHTAGSSPLYVVDGIIINSGDLSRNTNTSNALAGINANDIESVNVLKDAQATSIYGSRGANGVIVITTKKGRAGKTRFRADAEVGMNKFSDLPEHGRFLNADEWFMLLEEGVRNAGGTPAQVASISARYGKGNGVNTNWLDLITRTGAQQQYNLSASGGDEKNQFYMSGGYFKQVATVIGSDFKRYSFRTNFRHVVNDRLSFNLIASAGNTRQHTPINSGFFANPVSSLGFLRPSVNPYNPDGTLNIKTSGGGNFDNGTYNPLYIAMADKGEYSSVPVQGTLSGEFNILRNLKFTSRFGVDNNNIEEYSYNNPFHGDGASQSGIGISAYSRYFNWTATNQLDYNTSFLSDKSLRLDAKVGYETQKSKNYFITARSDVFPSNLDLYYSVNAATPKTARLEASDYDFAGLYSSTTLSFNEKYILSGSFRRDGSSRFSNSNPYGNFWSVGAAWNLNKERFLQDVSYISGIKLRGSYGLTGNANGLANYGWRRTFTYGSNYNQLPGGTFSSIGNPELSWETQYQTDLGADASFFKDRLSLVFDWYRRISGDLLFAVPVSRTIGFPTITRNTGKIENKGYEVTLNGTPVKSKNFTWDLSVNLTHNRNKVVKTPDHQDIGNGSFLLREGYDYQSWYVREWAGVDPANGDPLWWIDGTHQKTTNNYNLAQRQLIGSAAPKYFGGASTTISYLGFEVSADASYVFGNLVRDSWMRYLIDGFDPGSNKVALNLQRWQKPGDITNVPKYVYGSTNSSQEFTSRFLYKGDFVRLKNLTVGYNMDSKLARKFGLSMVRFYVRGTNLFTKTWDKNLTVDPEQGVNSASDLNIFYTKSMTVGLNLGF